MGYSYRPAYLGPSRPALGAPTAPTLYPGGLTLYLPDTSLRALVQAAALRVLPTPIPTLYPKLANPPPPLSPAYNYLLPTAPSPALPYTSLARVRPPL